MKNKYSGGPLVGGSSLLVIFAVLCLIVFALLSLSTAHAGEKLSLQSAQSVASYYQADCAAEEILAQLRAGESPAGVTESNGVYSYTCPISDMQALEVDVYIFEDNYSILRWQSISTVEWVNDDAINLWDGT